LPDSIPARVFTEKAAKEAVRMAQEAVDFVRSEITKLQATESAKQKDQPE